MQEQNDNIIIKDEFAGWKRKIILFLSGQAISLFGSSLVGFAIIWYITLTTRSGIMMTISTICAFLPQILISLFAGVWADRYNRKLLIIFADILIAFSTLILAILFLLGYGKLWQIFVISGIRSVGAGIQMPAVSALIPQLVPFEKLMKVNGINGSIQSLIMLISPAASGALLSVSTLEVIFFIDVVTAAIAVVILLTIIIPTHKKAEESLNTGYFEDLKAGIGYVNTNVYIRSLLVFYAFFTFLIVPAAFLTPLLIARTFGDEVWRLTANEVIFSAGAAIGGVIIAAWGGFKNRIYTIALSSIAFGMLTVLLGISDTFILYLIIMFVVGISMPFFNSPSIVLLQEKVEQNMQGRVFGLVQIVSSTSMPLGMLIFGPIADIIKIELLLIITGVLIAVLGVSIFYNRQFKAA